MRICSYFSQSSSLLETPSPYLVAAYLGSHVSHFPSSAGRHTVGLAPCNHGGSSYHSGLRCPHGLLTMVTRSVTCPDFGNSARSCQNCLSLTGGRQWKTGEGASAVTLLVNLCLAKHKSHSSLYAAKQVFHFKGRNNLLHRVCSESGRA